MSTFQGLSVALSSLQTQRRAMEVAGHNVANAATPGYTRQRTDMVSVPGAATPLSTGSRGWTTGQGVAVAQVARLTDRLASSRLELATGDAAQASTRAGVLQTVQAGFAEPGDNGLQKKLGNMWSAWDTLAQQPTGDAGAAARVTVVGRSEEVAATLRAGADRTSSTWTDVRTELGTLETQVNSVSASIGELNRMVVEVTASGAPAHDLADKRDVLVRQLSQLVGATSVERKDGSVDVMVGGEPLVTGRVARQLTVTGPPAMTGATTAATSVTFADTGAPAAVGGTAGALTEALSTTLPDVMAGYDRVAASVATKINDLHGTPPVFTAAGGGAITAAGITASIAPGDVRAGTAGTDNDVAEAVTRLASTADGPDGQWRTFAVGYAGQASAAEIRANAAQSAASSAQGVLTSSTAVDVDSEMVDLLTFQRAYEGAARVLTAVDQMLDTLINRTGVVGR
ncbi:flagellar hook-associated protein FlgK [uncultured Pseudokineococcus sp.]|uniref:flagellar hook-associated protein FlgK n=1 Tax=uncultured Pseudokineococcus sp. TaxID=1642928 RepID=UPI00260D2909|nr:flagellar hook-associated protein FlgK [uncultured Pseudokineococcus sp.]